MSREFNLVDLSHTRPMERGQLLRFLGLSPGTSEELPVGLKTHPKKLPVCETFLVVIYDGDEPSGIPGKAYNLVVSIGGVRKVLDRGRCFSEVNREGFQCIRGNSAIVTDYTFVCVNGRC